MKNNIGITVASIGLLLSIIAPTLFEDQLTFKYGVLILGVALTILGAYNADKERKAIKTAE